MNFQTVEAKKKLATSKKQVYEIVKEAVKEAYKNGEFVFRIARKTSLHCKSCGRVARKIGNHEKPLPPYLSYWKGDPEGILVVTLNGDGKPRFGWSCVKRDTRNSPDVLVPHSGDKFDKWTGIYLALKNAEEMYQEGEYYQGGGLAWQIWCDDRPNRFVPRFVEKFCDVQNQLLREGKPCWTSHAIRTLQKAKEK